MDNDHYVLAAQGEAWSWVFAGGIGLVVLALAALFIGALVSVLRSGMTGGMKVVWVVFAFCAPFLGPVLWFLVGKKDVEGRRIRV
ncbi:PLD nuclease N-terminal domain-containing protein [Umezawaea endophytica]|uniref:PLD nuclease N-terminal domain-containing protein n=1 Tax=Umezawaea endophytica TaxID=1654476 RepID=A0A9X2VP09_9PSEU|nr:PLD nuclease N-terminal domain-containing protein [Umezawaea endophytica]MCS7479542.1 PLD nuclease N-terminal domain-containing protein [Umezawaea endophytica]